MAIRSKQLAHQFDIVGRQALAMVLNGKLSINEATSNLLMLRALWAKKQPNRNRVKQFFKRKNELKNTDLTYYHD